MDLNQLKEWLATDGFKFAPQHDSRDINHADWYAYRRSALTARECECNDDKPAQIIVKPFVFTHHGITHMSVEVELTGQYGNWWQLKAYAISFEELKENLPSIEAKLIRAWNALAPA